MNNETIKLQVFENGLWEAYQQVKSEDKTLWVSLHKVMAYVGLPLELFNERLKQLWENQFTSTPKFANKYSFGLEVDATPTDHYQLRKRQIIIDGCPMFIIQMGIKNSEVNNGSI